MIAPARRVFRFAPSPTGRLHLGHAYSALLNFDLARASGGRFLLRIEDTDLTRARPEFETAIYEDLAWLGLEWEKPVRRQSEHFDDYLEAVKRLDAYGLLYPCTCTRADIAGAVGENGARDPDGAPLYPGTCRNKPRPPLQDVLGRPDVALRLDMAKALALLPSLRGAELRSNPEVACDSWIVSPSARNNDSSFARLAWREFAAGEIEAHPEQWGDVVIARKDAPTSYHLSVVVDDALQGVTDVVRGKDLFHATSLHRLLQQLLDLPTPDYRHHELLLDADGKKLSKSRLSTGLRAEGAAIEQLKERAAREARSAQ